MSFNDIFQVYKGLARDFLTFTILRDLKQLLKNHGYSDQEIEALNLESIAETISQAILYSFIDLGSAIRVNRVLLEKSINAVVNELDKRKNEIKGISDLIRIIKENQIHVIEKIEELVDWWCNQMVEKYSMIDKDKFAGSMLGVDLIIGKLASKLIFTTMDMLLSDFLKCFDTKYILYCYGYEAHFESFLKRSDINATVHPQDPDLIDFTIEKSPIHLFARLDKRRPPTQQLPASITGTNLHIGILADNISSDIRKIQAKIDNQLRIQNIVIQLNDDISFFTVLELPVLYGLSSKPNVFIFIEEPTKSNIIESYLPLIYLTSTVSEFQNININYFMTYEFLQDNLALPIYINFLSYLEKYLLADHKVGGLDQKMMEDLYSIANEVLNYKGKWIKFLLGKQLSRPSTEISTLPEIIREDVEVLLNNFDFARIDGEEGKILIEGIFLSSKKITSSDKDRISIEFRSALNQYMKRDLIAPFETSLLKFVHVPDFIDDFIILRVHVPAEYLIEELIKRIKLINRFYNRTIIKRIKEKLKEQSQDIRVNQFLEKLAGQIDFLEKSF